MRRLLVLLATLGVVAGCSTSTAGTPSSQTAPASATSQAAEIDLPQRPRNLRLDRVDPCSLLTPAQRIALGLDGQPRAGTTSAPIYSGPTCSITGFKPRDIAVGLGLATGNGIEAFTAPGVARAHLTLTEVLDFPAVLARPSLQSACSVDIDVAEGQFLDVLIRDAGSDPPISQDQLCLDAAHIAEEAIRTLADAGQ